MLNFVLLLCLDLVLTAPVACVGVSLLEDSPKSFSTSAVVVLRLNFGGNGVAKTLHLLLCFPFCHGLCSSCQWVLSSWKLYDHLLK